MGNDAEQTVKAGKVNVSVMSDHTGVAAPFVCVECVVG